MGKVIKAMFLTLLTMGFTGMVLICIALAHIL